MNKLIKETVDKVVTNEFIHEVSYSNFYKSVTTASSSQKRNKAHKELQSKLDEAISVLNHIGKLKESTQEDLSMKEQTKIQLLTKLKDIYLKIKEL